MSNDEVQDLKDAIVNLAHQLQRMSDKQDEMIADVRQIKEAIYNPEQGLYARVRDLEQWQAGISKFIWSFGLAIVGLIIQALYTNTWRCYESKNILWTGHRGCTSKSQRAFVRNNRQVRRGPGAS